MSGVSEEGCFSLSYYPCLLAHTVARFRGCSGGIRTIRATICSFGVKSVNRRYVSVTLRCRCPPLGVSLASLITTTLWESSCVCLTMFSALVSASRRHCHEFTAAMFTYVKQCVFSVLTDQFPACWLSNSGGVWLVFPQKALSCCGGGALVRNRITRAVSVVGDQPGGLYVLLTLVGDWARWVSQWATSVVLLK